MNQETKINFNVPDTNVKVQTAPVNTAATQVAPQPAPKVVEQPTAATQQAVTQIANSQEFLAEFAKIFASTLAQSQAADRQVQQEMLQKQKDQAVYENSTVGRATESFRAQMEDIVANHPEDCVDMIYYDALAKTYGGVFNISINGYVISFVRGATTRIPKCLLPNVHNRFSDIMTRDAEASIGASVPGKVNGDKAQIDEEVYDNIKAGPGK